MHHFRRALAFSALVVAWSPALLPAIVQAQSSYTMTVLNKPSGAVGFVPTAIDATGVVHGGSYYSTGYVFVNGGTGSCWICPRFSQRQATWPAGTGSAVTGTNGAQGFFGIAVSSRGTLVGGDEGDNKDVGQRALTKLHPDVPDTAWKLMRAATSMRVSLLRAGNVIPVPLPPDAATSTSYPYAFTVTGINADEVVLVNKSGTGTSLAAPYTWFNGQFTPLDTSVAASGESTLADAINDAGLIVGHTLTVTDMLGKPDPASVRPVIWQQGRAQRMAGGSLAGYQPVAVNLPGQVLLQKARANQDSPTDAAIWFNGVVTPIKSLDGRDVHATAINDSGTVIGCLVQRQLYGGTQSPFIWQNGSLQNLETVVKARGVRLPAGTKLGCPMALNNAGSIVAYYVGTGTPDKRTWVRLNAR